MDSLCTPTEERGDTSNRSAEEEKDFSSTSAKEEENFPTETDPLLIKCAPASNGSDMQKNSMNMQDMESLTSSKPKWQVISDGIRHADMIAGQPSKIQLNNYPKTLSQLYGRVFKVIEMFNIPDIDFRASPPDLKDEEIDDSDSSKSNRFSSYTHLSVTTRPYAITKLIEAYQLPAPDFIVSIQTADMLNNEEKNFQISVETMHAIQHGLSAIGKTTYPWITTSCINKDMINRLKIALHRDMCDNDVPLIVLNRKDSRPETATKMLDSPALPTQDVHRSIELYCWIST
ncbi:unnamed protein product [Rotaria socialis]|uniref:TRPM SLOG domain-containing protein n=4 Tax=Rotaria socialis TaxID=392032 RepID=A0A821PDM0_9BILA|nr:unnamed protein product [Rotaria socialis]